AYPQEPRPPAVPAVVVHAAEQGVGVGQTEELRLKRAVGAEGRVARYLHESLVLGHDDHCSQNHRQSRSSSSARDGRRLLPIFVDRATGIRTVRPSYTAVVDRDLDCVVAGHGWSPWGRAVWSWWRGDTVPEMRESRRGCRDHACLWNWKI